MISTNEVIKHVDDLPTLPNSFYDLPAVWGKRGNLSYLAPSYRQSSKVHKKRPSRN